MATFYFLGPTSTEMTQPKEMAIFNGRIKTVCVCAHTLLLACLTIRPDERGSCRCIVPGPRGFSLFEGPGMNEEKKKTVEKWKKRGGGEQGREQITSQRPCLQCCGWFTTKTSHLYGMHVQRAII